ncbi:MAG TPA: hypothetical protein VEL07_07760 [Planctomycetota bacterium]|nr:hypothetical protein [Planctomycetota bacterium]
MNDNLVSAAMKKVDLMADRISQDWAARDWAAYLDDHLYTGKSGYIKRHWKWLDKYLYLESGRFESEVSGRLGFDSYTKVMKRIDQARESIQAAVPDDLAVDSTVGPLIYMLHGYLFSWAPSDAYSDVAPKILSAFPMQGIVCGFTGNDVNGQLIVYRPVRSAA